MRLIKIILPVAVALLCVDTATATGRNTSSIYLEPADKADVTIPFAISSEGIKLPIRWGMDVAWDSDQNMRKGINHIGKANLSLVRGSFQTTEPLINDSVLTNKQITRLSRRMQLARLAGDNIDIVLNEDQEAGIDSWYGTSGNANATRWASLINATVKWIQNNYPKNRVVAVSPFNEPDYGWGQGSKADFKAIAQLLKESYPRFKDIDITAGNTLNCDAAMSWYDAVKPYAAWGNTHQLAGAFDTYAGFFEQVRADGNYAYADELHNVGEAMVGAEYGLQAGVWWGFDSRARGEFCHISNHGSRIGYGENRSAWTAASVYRDDETGQVKAFVGSSERQAVTSSFQFVSTDHAVYYDGRGPLRELRVEVPGGAKGSYQNGQTNAECVVDVTWGADVAPARIDGTYKIMNKATEQLVAVYGTFDGNENIAQMKDTGEDVQHWRITPVDPRIGGDYSFYNIINVDRNKHMDVLNFSTLQGVNIIAWANATASSNEQWYLQYAGDGYYYIRNRESGFYLTLQSKNKGNGINIMQYGLLIEANRDRQLWRIIPTDAECETEAPAQPATPVAKAHTASVELEWEANTEPDLDGYMILRAEQGTDSWNTIARKVKGTRFVDNTCLQGRAYSYKIKAIDRSDNQSVCSDEAAAAVAGSRAMIARWHMDGDMTDATENQMDAAVYGMPIYSAAAKSGAKALLLGGSKSYVQLPYAVASTGELTVAMWVKWSSASNAWQRIFDFGNGTDSYLFLTPGNGNAMRFAIKNGGAEQVLDCPAQLATGTWKHVAVSIAQGRTAIYIDGEVAAESSAITISPADIKPVLNYLGRSQFTADPYFNGYLDDVRIYNYALDAAELQGVMTDLTNGIGTAAATTVDGAQREYDLSGRSHRAGSRGVRIVQATENGRKTAKKMVK